MPTLSRTQYIRHPAVIVVNDLHLGDPNGRIQDLFDRDAEFATLLLETIPNQFGWPSTLVLAGDFIDFTQVSPEHSRHRYGARFGTTQAESVDKLERVIDGHPIVFAALAEFLDRGGQVLILPGNHDVDFCWPEVMNTLRARLSLADSERLTFVPSGYLYERGLYIEHGHQLTTDNCFHHWPNPIVMAGDGPRLERPWGTRFMELVYNELPDLHPYIYGLLPRPRFVGILLRSFLDGDGISADAIGRMVPFFLRTGARPFGKKLMAPSRKTRRDVISRSVSADVLVFAHTHLLECQSLSVAGRSHVKQRWFNSGTWLPLYVEHQKTSEHWSDLIGHPQRHDVRFLAVDWWRDQPRAQLLRTEEPSGANLPLMKQVERSTTSSSRP